MSQHTTTRHICDSCNKSLKSFDNNLCIVTGIRDENPWSRLKIRIEYQHGMHNDSTTDDADLCQKCAIKLLTYALKRVKAGERTTKGTGGSMEEGKWI